MNTISNNIVNIDVSNNLEEYLLHRYMDFINTSNNSLHSMISIINEQQSSFNLLLSRYDMFTPSRTVRRPSRHLSSYNSRNYYATSPANINRPYFSTSLYDNYSNRPNIRPNTDILGNYVSYMFQDTLNNQSTNNQTRPSFSQINAAITRIQYEEIENPLNYSCPISQIDFSNNDMVIMLRSCRHIFSEDSILRWFERNVYCPLCRHDIRIMENVINNENIDISDNQQIQNLSN